eukprot:scaffold26745_cov54-Phaeocystis_antarctica.AAC.3
MKYPHNKLLGKCVWRMRKLFGSAWGCGSGEHVEGENSAHRGPGRAGKRTPVEDAAGAGRQKCLPKVEIVEPSLASSLW